MFEFEFVYIVLFLSFNREEMFMVLGSNILAWSILTMLPKDHMLSTRLVNFWRARFLKYSLVLRV